MQFLNPARLCFSTLIALQYCGTCSAIPSTGKNSVILQRSPPVLMGFASAYGAIAATTLTSTGNTLIVGNCGTFPGTSITGFPPGICTGTTSSAGTPAANAEAACLTAYNNARASGPTTALPASNVGGLVLNPGVYTFPTSAATLDGILTLNGTFLNSTTNSTLPSTGQFIFLITTTFATAVSSQILLINGAKACNVYFIVGSSATIAGASALQGNFLAYTSIAVRNGASNQGTFCALHGAVTLINDALTAQTVCST